MTTRIPGTTTPSASMTITQVFAEMEALGAAGVIDDYALGGAVAAVHYLEPMATQDVDMFAVFRSDVGSPLAPLTRVYEFLVKRGARIEGEHLIIGGWAVQLLPVAGSLLQEAIQNARTVNVDGQSVRIFSAEHLAAIALETGRAKDKLRLVQFLEWSEFDRAGFDSIVQRHGLLAKWQRFKRVYDDET